jgi:4-amino-4-deoxy-L-arabinose transferase-like glycosyltransferase
MAGSFVPAYSAPPRRPTEAALTRVLRSHALFFLLLVVAGVLYASTLSAYGMLMWDEAEYASIGRSVLRGEGFAIGGHPNALRPPVTPLGVTVSMWLSGRGTDVVAKSSTLVFALLALTIVYASAVKAYDRPTGLIAATLLAVAPWFWTSTPQVLSEIPFLVFFAGAVWCLEFALYRDAGYFAYSGLCAALALLTRYTGLLFGPIALTMLAVALLTGGPAVRQRVLSRRALAGVVVGALALAPWFVRQYLVFGDPLIGVKISSSQLQAYMPSVFMPWHFYFTRLPRLLGPLTVALLLAGSAQALWRRDRFALHSLAVALSLLLWFSVYRYKEDRLVSSTLPFLCVVGAVALTRTRLPGPRAGMVAATAVVCATCAWNYTLARPVLARVITNGYPQLLDALRYVADHSDSDAMVIGASVPQIVWYSDRPVHDFPDESKLPDLLAHARWVLITNFERGQRAYARDLVKKVREDDLRSRGAILFSGRRFTVLLLDADLLQGRL